MIPTVPDKAFELAEKGGYLKTRIEDRQNWQFYILQPDWWQSLEKSLNWFGVWSREYWTSKSDQLHAKGLDRFGTTEEELPPWRWYSARFYDLILTGGDTEKFWEELLAAK